jgi:hypothetical protein
MVEVLLHRLSLTILLVAVVLIGCGGGYSPPDKEAQESGSKENDGAGQAIQFVGQWKLLSLSSDSARTDLAASGLDVVLDLSADGTARWHVKEDGQNYYYCSADDMVFEQDQEANHQVSLSYHRILIDPETRQVTQNDGVKQIDFSVSRSGDDLVELLDGHPPQGIVMLPEFDAYNEQELVSLTLQAAAIDLSGSMPTQESAPLCNVKSGVVDSSVDEEAPVITRFELTSATQTSDQAIAFNLEGRDNVAVSAWLINESSAVPTLDDAIWSDTKPSVYTLSSGYGMKTVYAWASDAAGNISDPASFNVEYIEPPDPVDDQAPVITRFELTSGTPTTDQAIAFDLEGRDNVAVSAWLVNESSAIPAMDDAGWSGSRPLAYTLSFGYGMKTVYAWVRDAVGNISDPALFSVEYTLPPCHYVESTVLPTGFRGGGIVEGGNLESLLDDDNNYLYIDPDRTDQVMDLTVDFDFADTDVRDLKVTLSSRSESRYPSYQRTVYALNHVTIGLDDWDIVEPAREIGESEVRSEIVLSDIVENISDYLGQENDRLTFTLMIRMQTPSYYRDHLIDLVQLTVTHPEDPNCVDE